MSQFDYDFIIIGSGAGGSTIAGKLASRGQSVLLIERSSKTPSKRPHKDEIRMHIAREAGERDSVVMNTTFVRPHVGNTLGGGMALYGGVMLRPSPRDFEPGKAYAKYIERPQWDWPITYKDLEPYFTEAEDLFHVSGDINQRFSSLGRRDQAYKGSPQELSQINRRISKKWNQHHLEHFQLPQAINFSKCLNCVKCAGFYCSTNARRSSYTASAEPHVESGRLSLLQGREATRLNFQGRTVTSVDVRSGHEKSTKRLTARVFILAAGAIHSPRLLHQSGFLDPSHMLGRNYMYHLGVLAVAGYRRRTEASERNIKQLGSANFYDGAKTFPHKLGLAQAIPIPGPETLRAQMGIRFPRSLVNKFINHLVSFGLIIEDLPQVQNRIILENCNRPKIRHQFHPYDVFRAQGAKTILKNALKITKPLFSSSFDALYQPDFISHQVGTCRFGKNPKTSTLNEDCRLHGVNNAYVVDGSFMPTSLGVGPGLTIAANALRVADKILGATK